MRRMIVLLSAMLLVLGMMATSAAANNGKGNAPERGNTTETLGFHERADELTVDQVHPEVADPTKANFDEQFIYYHVTYEEVSYETHLYREVSRLDGNFEFGGGTSDAFWYGVTGPDADGVQHEIGHDGLAVQYFRTDDGWRSLTASFAKNDYGHGLLTDVNGDGPEGVFGDIEWTSAPGANIQSTFSTAQGRIVTTNVDTGTSRSIDVGCIIIDDGEMFVDGINDQGDPVIFYVRAEDGEAVGIGQWTNSGQTCENRWVGGGTVTDGFIKGLG